MPAEEGAERCNRPTGELRGELDSSARLAAIVDSSQDSIISWTPGQIIATWNPESERMYGYRADEAIGRDLSLIVPPADIAEIGRVHEQVLRGEPVQTIETRRVRRDGTVFDVAVTVSPIRDATGRIAGLSAIGRDITVARRAEEALRSSEARKGAVLASALDAIITMNSAGAIEECNPAAQRMFGSDCADVLGRDLAEVLTPGRAGDGSDSGLERYLATGDEALLGRRSELTAIRADGSPFPAEASVTLVDGPGPSLYIWFIRDRTAEKAAEAERQSLEDRLHQSERLESLGRLAGGVAHDFNNLLAVIMNYASFVAESVPDDAAIQSDIQKIVSASDRAARLTRQLLMFARREPVELETLDLDEVVEGFRSLLLRSLGEQVELVLDAEGELPPIRADRGQVEQVLINLALNARDAMLHAGIVTFETSVVDLDRDHEQRHATRPGRYVRLSVVDCGVGMSTTVSARAFEPFFTTKRATEGSGLGLATVYGIVSDLGGDVTLSSEEGVGTTISVYFPVATASAAPEKAGSSPAPVGGNGETVLVVEDQAAATDRGVPSCGR